MAALPFVRSNRTFMELKSLPLVLVAGAMVGSNRTFMELKFKLYHGSLFAVIQF